MPAEQEHHVAGRLRLALCLAITAGFVDAYLYSHVTPVFVANMSGNMVRSGMAIGDTDLHAVLAALCALGGFLVGIGVATVLVDQRLRERRNPSPGMLLRIEGVLLGVAAALIASAHLEYADRVDGTRAVVIAVASAAMGAQVIALRRVGQVAVSTTYGTGAIVRLGEKAALGLRRTPSVTPVRRRLTIVVLGIVLIGYVGGAALGAAFGDSRFLLVVPSLAVLAMSFAPDLPAPRQIVSRRIVRRRDES